MRGGWSPPPTLSQSARKDGAPGHPEFIYPTSQNRDPSASSGRAVGHPYCLLWRRLLLLVHALQFLENLLRGADAVLVGRNLGRIRRGRFFHLLRLV